MSSFFKLITTLLTLSASCCCKPAVQQYDYIIIGGGLSGLVLARELSEDASKSVLVLEAGDAHLDDPLITIPGFVGSTVGNSSYDWNFNTVPQEYANNNTYIWNRGKALGGSTAINFMAWGRPAKEEIDAIANLGNPNWTGDDLFQYMRKAETFTHPSPSYASENNLTFTASAHGTSGPLHNSFSQFISEGQEPWISAMEALGVRHVHDALSGEDVGVWMAPATIDARTQTRSYSASAFYTPVANRSNLVVEVGAEVQRIATVTQSNGLVAASQVEYIQDGIVKFVNATQGSEVILSAGAIKTPQLLELSGIGDPNILEPLNITVKVDLPGVGAGVVDQFFFGVSYELNNDSIVTLDNLRDPQFEASALAEYQANKTGLFTIGVTAFSLHPLAIIVGSESKAKEMIDAQAVKISTGNYTKAQKEKWAVIINGLRNPSKIGHVEIVGFPGFFTTASSPVENKRYLTFTGDLQLPFSTGHIHITSNNASIQPGIDPHYFEQDFDLQVLVETLKFIRKLASTAGFKDLLGQEIDPGSSVQSDEEIIDYIKMHGSPEYHTIGSAAMLPREKGGVVSPELKVYGTANIRVVDLSILPLQITAHPMSTLYGVAEKAADIIKQQQDEEG